MSKLQKTQVDQKGFTIIELMIATLIFAVIVLLVTGAIISIGRSYSKGSTSTRTQEAARRITDDIQQAIIFSQSEPRQIDSLNVLCVGDKQYSYTRGRQVTDSNWGLIVRAGITGCGTAATAISPGQGRPGDFTELLGNGMRLSNFSVTKSGEAWKVTVRVVSGDNDLLCLDGGSGGADCSSVSSMNQSEIDNQNGLRCKNIREGNEFCAMSELSTLVTQRVQ